MNEIDSNLDAFKIIALVFPIIFVFVFAGIFFALLKVLKQWNENNKKPLLTTPAKVISKRTKFTPSKKHNQIGHSSTSYYITFEVEGGEQIEFRIDEANYGQFIEDDFGKLTYQGTRFIQFER